jgi:hypothetical protein
MSNMGDVLETTRSAAPPRNAPIHLSFEEGAREVCVHAEDEDRFWMTCEEAARACKQHVSVVEWKREFTRLLGWLRLWSENEKGRVKECFVSLRDNRLAITVVPMTQGFDFDLANAVTALDSNIAREFKSCPSEVLQVPRPKGCGLDGLVDLSNTVLVYGS